MLWAALSLFGTTRFSYAESQITGGFPAETKGWSKPPTLSLELGTNSLLIEGLTPGGSAAVLSVSQLPIDWTHRTVPKAERVSDEKGRGTLTVSVGGGVAETSAWIVVDLQTGSIAATSPEDIAPWVAGPDGSTLLSSPQSLSVADSSLAVMVVRPGIGAWWRTAYDGAAGDTGPEDGELVVDLTTCQWISSGGWEPNEIPFAGLEPGDVVVGIDPIHFDHFASQATN